MISQILQFFAQFWRQLIFWAVMDSEQVGFVRRVGVPNREMSPGWNWKWPLIETAEIEDAREYTLVLDPQSLRTRDGIDVVVRASVTCQVFDAQKYVLGVYDGRTNVQDLVGGELGTLVQERRSSSVLGGKILPALLHRSRKVARKWGIEIVAVKLLDSARSPSMRLWQNQITSSGQE